MGKDCPAGRVVTRSSHGVLICQQVVVSDAAARPPLQPSWARSPASPSVDVLEQRAKAWHMAHHKERVTVGNTRGQEEDRPSLKRQRSS